MAGERFDVCFFWHGPEHLHEDETAGVLRMLEGIINDLILLGMPYGTMRKAQNTTTATRLASGTSIQKT